MIYKMSKAQLQFEGGADMSKKKEEEDKEVKASEGLKLRPAEWASQKGISNVIIAGAFCDCNIPMTEADFEKKLKSFMEKPASY